MGNRMVGCGVLVAIYDERNVAAVAAITFTKL
jgi:hypothetical protein